MVHASAEWLGPCRQTAVAAEHYDGIMGQVLSAEWPVHHVRECLFNHSPSPQVTRQVLQPPAA